eukprot:1029504-Pelagomonas_calceolata.AAC.2
MERLQQREPTWPMHKNSKVSAQEWHPKVEDGLQGSEIEMMQERSAWPLRTSMQADSREQ